MVCDLYDKIGYGPELSFFFCFSLMFCFDRSS
jgi:hypothetical protein